MKRERERREKGEGGTCLAYLSFLKLRLGSMASGFHLSKEKNCSKKRKKEKIRGSGNRGGTGLEKCLTQKIVQELPVDGLVAPWRDAGRTQDVVVFGVFVGFSLEKQQSTLHTTSFVSVNTARY